MHLTVLLYIDMQSFLHHKYNVFIPKSDWIHFEHFLSGANETSVSKNQRNTLAHDSNAYSSTHYRIAIRDRLHMQKSQARHKQD